MNSNVLFLDYLIEDELQLKLENELQLKLAKEFRAAHFEENMRLLSYCPIHLPQIDRETMRVGLMRRFVAMGFSSDEPEDGAVVDLVEYCDGRTFPPQGVRLSERSNSTTKEKEALVTI